MLAIFGNKNIDKKYEIIRDTYNSYNYQRLFGQVLHGMIDKFIQN